MKIFNGDIFKISDTQKVTYIMVLSEKKNSVYVIQCDSSGNISNKHNLYCINSHHLIDGTAERISNIPMKRHDVRTNENHYVWFTLQNRMMTPQETAINAEMSQLDSRYQLFLDTASEYEKQLFSKNEDANNHKHNNLFISLYADFYKIKMES